MKIISGFCIIFVVNILNNLNNYNQIVTKAIRGKDSNVLSNTIGTMSFSNLISSESSIIFMLGILVCILYSIVIWKKDFNGKSKSIYTLAMLPQDRMKVYMSKFFNIISLVYMYIISFTIVLFLCYIIMPKFMKGEVEGIGFIKDTIYTFGMFIPYSIETFIIVYVFLISSAISIIFTVNIGYDFKANIAKTVAVLFLSLIIYQRFNYYINIIINGKNIKLIICILSSIIVVICGLISKKSLSRIDY